MCNTNQATVYQIKTCLRNCSYIAEKPIDTHNIKIDSPIFVHTHEHKHKQRVGIAQLNRRSLQTHDRLECQKCTLTSHTSKTSFACTDSWPLAAHTREGFKKTIIWYIYSVGTNEGYLDMHVCTKFTVFYELSQVHNYMYRKFHIGAINRCIPARYTMLVGFLLP